MVVHPDSHKISRVPWYSGTSCAAIRFRIRGSHPLWPDIPVLFYYLITDRVMKALQPRMAEATRFGLFPFRSPLLGE